MNCTQQFFRCLRSEDLRKRVSVLIVAPPRFRTSDMAATSFKRCIWACHLGADMPTPPQHRTASRIFEAFCANKPHESHDTETHREPQNLSRALHAEKGRLPGQEMLVLNQCHRCFGSSSDFEILVSPTINAKSQRTDNLRNSSLAIFSHSYQSYRFHELKHWHKGERVEAEARGIGQI